MSEDTQVGTVDTEKLKAKHKKSSARPQQDKLIYRALTTFRTTIGSQLVTFTQGQLIDDYHTIQILVAQNEPIVPANDEAVNIICPYCKMHFTADVS